MGDQGEMHFRLDKLEEFLHGSDRQARAFILEHIEDIFTARAENANEMQWNVVRIAFGSPERLEKFRELLLDHSDPATQVHAVKFTIAALGFLKKAPDFSLEAVEIVLKSKSPAAADMASSLVLEYLKKEAVRGRVMDFLSSQMMLERSKDMCAKCRNIATSALEYPDARDDAILILAGIMEYKDANPMDRECALKTIAHLFSKGTDISNAERALRVMAKDRDDLLYGEARGLMKDAEKLCFNRPGEMSFRRRPLATLKRLVPQTIQRLVRPIAAAS